MKKIVSLLCFLALIGSASGESMKMTNTQADQLLAALMSLDSGLTAANTTIAADNINSLRPRMEAYAKGQNTAQKKYGIVQGMKMDDPAVAKYQAEAEANAANEITVELTRFSLTDEEITAAKIKPSNLAMLRLWLLPAKK